MDPRLKSFTVDTLHYRPESVFFFVPGLNIVFMTFISLFPLLTVNPGGKY